MISVTEAKTLVSQHAQPLPPVMVPIAAAGGLVLANDVYAFCDIPAFRQSSMDGYALQYEPEINSLILAGEMAAGTENKTVINPGEAYRIFTGAPLPAGADTVVMQEKVKLEKGKVIILDQQLKKGMNAREQGSEIKTGELAMHKHELLTPAALGFLAGLGIAEVSVFPKPKVAIILTGNELQQPGLPLKFGQVYESNSYALCAALAQRGITNVEVLIAKDDLQALTAVLAAALKTHELILLTGGVSVGDYDFVVQAASSCGVTQVFHKVKQKPGKPLFFGSKGPKLVFGLPGNPSSVLSCYYNYVLPALAQLSGHKNKCQTLKAALASDYTKAAGLTHFLKGSFAQEEVLILGAQESFRLRSFAQANCLICLEEDKTEFLKGDQVDIILLSN